MVEPIGLEPITGANAYEARTGGALHRAPQMSRPFTAAGFLSQAAVVPGFTLTGAAFAGP